MLFRAGKLNTQMLVDVVYVNLTTADYKPPETTPTPSPTPSPVPVPPGPGKKITLVASSVVNFNVRPLETFRGADALARYISSIVY